MRYEPHSEHLPKSGTKPPSRVHYPNQYHAISSQYHTQPLGDYKSWRLEVCCLLFWDIWNYGFPRTQGEKLFMGDTFRISLITQIPQVGSIFRTKKQQTKNFGVSVFKRPQAVFLCTQQTKTTYREISQNRGRGATFSYIPYSLSQSRSFSHTHLCSGSKDAGAAPASFI